MIGSSTNPGRLDQFVLDESGRWLERNADGVKWKRLSVEFDEVFTRYLHYHNIDSSHLLPALPIFPVENARGGLKKLEVILAGAAEALSGIKGTVILKDMFGEVIKRVRLSDDTQIDAGQNL